MASTETIIQNLRFEVSVLKAEREKRNEYLKRRMPELVPLEGQISIVKNEVTYIASSMLYNGGDELLTKLYIADKAVDLLVSSYGYSNTEPAHKAIRHLAKTPGGERKACKHLIDLAQKEVSYIIWRKEVQDADNYPLYDSDYSVELVRGTDELFVEVLSSCHLDLVNTGKDDGTFDLVPAIEKIRDINEQLTAVFAKEPKPSEEDGSESDEETSVNSEVSSEAGSDASGDTEAEGESDQGGESGNVGGNGSLNVLPASYTLLLGFHTVRVERMLAWKALSDQQDGGYYSLPNEVLELIEAAIV